MNMPIRSGGIFVPTDLIFVPLSMPKAAAVLKIVNSARNPPTTVLVPQNTPVSYTHLDVYKRQLPY